MGPSKNKRLSRSVLTDLMIFKNRWWQHLFFWAVVLLILFNIFKSSGSLEKIDVIYTLIFLFPILSIVYLNLYLLVPGVLRKERYLLYTLIFLILLSGGALFLYLLFDRWIDLILPGFYFISYYNLPVLMIYTGSFLVLTTLLKLSRSWFMLLRFERMTTTHQLQSLQSQINPHFLLNSLQTIYALSLDKSDRTPEVILQLSHILQYTLYETGQPSVKLRKEIGMIKNYVEMYRHRVDPRNTRINMEVKGDPGELLIAPMLLIPFIENSFKHGLSGGEDAAFVNIQMEISKDILQFSVRNSRGTSDGLEIEPAKGIGIRNTRQRLELLYPGKFKLDIEAEEEKYSVYLEIVLKQN
ncbi:MAG: histidine kinase [Bacteroidales bacterium]|nr:histidine kinase [Bacteroidales bacterium]